MSIVSNKNETVRLFKNNFLETFSHIHPATPFVVFVPIIAFFLYRSFTHLSFITVLPCYAGGILSWTLLEYLAHRFLFHFEATTPRGKYLVFLMHGIHHDYPRDATRLVMPLLVSLPLAITFYFFYMFIFGSYQAPVYAGLVTGYLGYDFIHFAVHHFKWTNNFFATLKAHHLKHHYAMAGRGYGVSNPLWDFVFGTLPKRDDQGEGIEPESDSRHSNPQPEEAHA